MRSGDASPPSCRITQKLKQPCKLTTRYEQINQVIRKRERHSLEALRRIDGAITCVLSCLRRWRLANPRKPLSTNCGGTRQANDIDHTMGEVSQKQGPWIENGVSNGEQYAVWRRTPAKL